MQSRLTIVEHFEVHASDPAVVLLANQLEPLQLSGHFQEGLVDLFGHLYFGFHNRLLLPTFSEVKLNLRLTASERFIPSRSQSRSA